jgi:hypothetical protein
MRFFQDAVTNRSHCALRYEKIVSKSLLAGTLGRGNHTTALFSGERQVSSVRELLSGMGFAQVAAVPICTSRVSSVFPRNEKMYSNQLAAPCIRFSALAIEAEVENSCSHFNYQLLPSSDQPRKGGTFRISI